MSNWPGNLIRKTPVTPSGGSASGVWSLAEAAYWKKQNLWPTLPGAPTIGTATAGGSSASVTFTAPTNTGTPSTITQYRVTSSPGAITATGASSPITVTGLTNGTSYTFTVAATNAAGTGPESASSNAVTPIFAVEDVFSTYLYTGNGSTQTITNGIDLSGQGGLVWIKSRTNTAKPCFFDTARGVSKSISSNNTNAQVTFSGVDQFNSASFRVNSDAETNGSGINYASWTFREAPNFFDVVTYTGTGSARTIAHNLGVAPGCIIVKRTDTTSDWQVYHQSTAAGMGPNKYMVLNTTAAEATGSDRWNNTAPTSTVFSVGNAPETNASGGTYVAYLFAHVTASDGIIQCGSYTGTSAAGNAQNLGWEPQWLMVKSSIGIGDWFILDNMRGIPTGGNDACLLANSSNAEFANADRINLTSTGFQFGGSDLNNSGTSYIYIAIRRGPMRTPTLGTTVFSPIAASTGTQTTNFPIDLQLLATRTFSGSKIAVDRLRGISSTSTDSGNYIQTNTTDAEASSPYTKNWNNVGFEVSANLSGFSSIYWNFRRAPSFFDEVCYTGTGNGVVQSVNHNLGVAPEMVIMKERTTAFYSWITWTTALNLSSTYGLLALNSNSGVGFSSNNLNSTAPTSTVVSVSADGNASGKNYVLYLFASCPGVSKVGSYTGTGTTQTINCGFTTGARFVLIKRTDSTGDWYVWDSARGIVAGDDPYILLNNTATEVTNTDYIDTDNSGFQISSTAPAAINANGGSFIYLAIS